MRLTNLAALLFLLSFVVSCKKKQELTKPVVQKITESVYASGIIKSKNQYQVFASVNGLVARKLVAEGDIIKKGDPIMLLSNKQAQLNTDNAIIMAGYSSFAENAEKLNQLKMNIQLARVKLLNDSSLLARQRNLWAQQIGTRNQLDERELAYNNSSTAYESAKIALSEMQRQVSFQQSQSQKNVEIAKTTAGDYVIKSETSGRVYSVLKEEGEMVSIQTPVAVIGDAVDFLIELQVDEYDIARVKAGQKILLSMDSYKKQVFEAKVEKIYPIMNERSRSFTVEAVFAKQPPALYPNLTCEANIVLQEKENALTIPRSFLMDGGYVLLKNKEKRKVVTGLEDYQLAEIIGGLTADDVILKPAE